MGVIKELNDAKVKKLLLYTKPGNLQKYFGKAMSGDQMDAKRAEIVRKISNSES